MNTNFQKNITSISNMMEKQNRSNTSPIIYSISSIPTFIQSEAKQWNINLHDEVSKMNALLARDNFFVNISDKLVQGLENRLLKNPSDNNINHTTKTTQFGLMYYLYLAIEKLYFQSSSDNFTEKLFGKDPFAEKLAIIRILWDIFCKWYIESTNDSFSEKLKEIDQIMTKEKLTNNDFNVFKQIFEPGLMLGFIIWLKAYFTPLLKSDGQIMLKTKEIIEGKNINTYINIINSDDDINKNYQIASKEIDKIINNKNNSNQSSQNNSNQSSKNNSNQSSQNSSNKSSQNSSNKSSQNSSNKSSQNSSNKSSKNNSNQSSQNNNNKNNKNNSNQSSQNININATMIASYYMGSVLAYIHKKNPKQYEKLFKDVEKLYNINNNTLDVSAIKAIFAIISKQNKNINFGEEDRLLLSKQIMEEDVLTGEASSTIFVSIINIYLRIKNFMKNVVVSEDDSNDTYHGDPIHLIKGLATSKGMLLKKDDQSTAELSGGYNELKKQANIEHLNNNVHMYNQVIVLKALIEKINSLINNVPVKYLTHFNVSNIPNFKELKGENYIVVAVTEDSERVIPILWIKYNEGNKTMAQIYLIKNKHETRKVYDISFNPTGDKSTLIGTIDIIKGSTPNNGYGKFTFNNSLFSDIQVDYLNPDNISLLRTGNIDYETLTKSSLSEIISELSLEMHFVNQQQMIYTLNAVITFHNGGKKSFLLSNVEDKEPVKNKPQLFGSIVKGNAADLKLCDKSLGQFMNLSNVQTAKSFLNSNSYIAYPELLNDTFIIVLNDNYVNNGTLNYNIASFPIFLHFLFLLRYNPSEFRSLKSAIKHNFNNVFQKQGKIISLDPTNNSAISKLRQPGCAQTLSDLISKVNNAIKSTSFSGGAKKAVKRIAKKIASKKYKKIIHNNINYNGNRGRGGGRGGGRGRGRGGERGRGHGRGRS